MSPDPLARAFESLAIAGLEEASPRRIVLALPGKDNKPHREELLLAMELEKEVLR